jgi:hypothetical protein
MIPDVNFSDNSNSTVSLLNNGMDTFLILAGIDPAIE